MKLTKKLLKQIIKEEIQNVLGEGTNLQEIFGFSKKEKADKELHGLAADGVEYHGAKEFLEKDPNLSPRDAIKLYRQKRQDFKDREGAQQDEWDREAQAKARRKKSEAEKQQRGSEELDAAYRARKRKKKKSSNDQWTGPGSMQGSHAGAWDNYDSRDSKLGRH